MRKFSFVLMLVFVVALILGVAALSAQGPDGAGWWTNFTIQNTTDSQVSVVTTAYPETGSSSTSTYANSTELPGLMSVIYHPGLDPNCTNPVTASGCRIGLTPALPANFEGSVVIESTGAVVAVTSLNNNQSGSVGASGGTARSSYQGMAADITDTTLYFPTVKNNFSGQTTVFFVQAAGADASVTVTYNMNDGSTKSDTQSIKANKTYAFAPSAVGVASCNGGNGGGSAVAPCFGGATVDSDTAIAGTVVEYVDGAPVAGYVLATRGLTPADAAGEIVAPTMKNNFNGATTGATILNTGASATTVNLGYSVTNTSGSCSSNIGDTATDSISLDPGQAKVVNFNQGNVGGLPNCVFYSMTATSAQDIVVTVNENRNYQGQTVKAVYSGFNTAAATPSAFFPLVKEYFNGQTTGVSAVNAGTSATKIMGTYTDQNGSVYVVESASSVAPGAAVSFFNLSGGNANFVAPGTGFPPAGSKNSVVLESSDGTQAVVGLSQESDRDSSNGTLDVTNYEGFNQ
jgi:hypothetical protein